MFIALHTADQAQFLS